MGLTSQTIGSSLKIKVNKLLKIVDTLLQANVLLLFEKNSLWLYAKEIKHEALLFTIFDATQRKSKEESREQPTVERCSRLAWPEPLRIESPLLTKFWWATDSPATQTAAARLTALTRVAYEISLRAWSDFSLSLDFIYEFLPGKRKRSQQREMEQRIGVLTLTKALVRPHQHRFLIQLLVFSQPIQRCCLLG